MKKKGLGRGLEALLGEKSKPAQDGATITSLPLGALQAGKYQPRQKMDSGPLQELAESIREQGVMQPLLVRAISAGKYEIIAGERRFRAATLAGLTEVPVLVSLADDKGAAAMALIENMQREDLNPLEESRGLARLIEEFGFTHEQAAKSVGKSRSAISNLLRLAQLAKPVQAMLLAGDIDLDGHAYQCTMNEKGERAIVWKPSDMDIVRYENDYRSKDSELKTLKLRIRSQMDLIHDDEINAMMMKMWALKHLPISESIMDFVEGRDTVIAGTHRTNANLLQGGVVSGWYKKGGHISSVSVEGYEKRGSFTIHSYQGQTIESGNVWIVIDDMFDYAMLYTAVSRCVSFSQLRFVKKI